MSIFRRKLMMLSEKYIMGIDFSKQPDNEIWYITTDGQKLEEDFDFIGGYGKQRGLEVISHTYENGIGKVVYNADVKVLGESAFKVKGYLKKQALLISLPRKLTYIAAYSFQTNRPNDINSRLRNLILNNISKAGSILPSQSSHLSSRIDNIYVMPGYSKYYSYLKDYNLKYNIIEKPLRDIEYITFENSNVERICLENFDINKDGKVSKEEMENVTSIGRLFNNIDIENLNDFQHFCNVTDLSAAFIGCSNLKVGNIWEGVQSLGSNLFMNATKLEKAIIPSTIRDMGQMWVRYKLIGKAEVIIKSETPPIIRDYNIQSVAKTLYVPDIAVDRYKANAPIIKYITNNILPMSEYRGD